MPEEFSERDSMALGENDLPKLRSYKPLQLFFMLRIGRLLRLRSSTRGAAEQSAWLERLLSKAIYSTYRDCVALGLDGDARTLFTKIEAERRT